EELPPEFQNLPPGAVVVQKPSESESWAALIIIAVGGLVLVGPVVALVLYLKRRPASAAGVAAADAADAPCAYLNDLHGITRDPAYEIGAKPVMLGRVAGTDRALDYIVVNQATVGRRHAIIEYKDFSYWIIDQGSTNGTFVNAERVEGERRLRHGDRIRLHNFEFEFVLPELDEGGKTLFVGNADQQLAEKTVVAASAAGLAAMGAAQAVDHAPAQSAYDPAQDDEFLDITSEREEDESDDTQMLAEQAAEDFHEGPTEMREPVPAAEPAQSDTLLRAYGGAPAAAPAAPAPDFNELETFARNEPLAGAGDDVSLDAFMDIDDSDAAASPGSPASLTGEFAELQTLVRGGAPAEREDGPEVSLDEFMSTSVFERGPDAPVAGESDRTVLAPHGPGGAGDYHDGGTVVLDSPLAAAPERDTSEDPTVLPSAAAPVPPAAPAASIDLAEDVTVAPGFGAGASVEDEMTLDEFVNASVYPGTAQDEGTRLQPRPEDDRTRVQPRPGSQEFPDPEQDDPDRTLMPSQVQDPPPKR
ncbi:MAG: FHA domain-containing protein, partial [Gammaproteobacteria bacterium]